MDEKTRALAVVVGYLQALGRDCMPCKGLWEKDLEILDHWLAEEIKADDDTETAMTDDAITVTTTAGERMSKE
jgi:hypothetical protein